MIPSPIDTSDAYTLKRPAAIHPRVTWWCAEVDAFGRRVDAFAERVARLDAQIAEISR